MKVGIGQDSHRFDFNNKEKVLILGGVEFPGHPPLLGNSDADVILHSLTNAVSGVTCVNILGKISDDMCLVKGITDSKVYLKEAIKYLGNSKIVHVSIAIECLTPKISPKISEIRESISRIMGISPESIGITATTGEGLTPFGRGEGIQVFSCITVE
ncbi:MAG TPA: 2-C-methyl-D-erythritol 2,4-cyclodiphosphate synthase [Clostridiaceae bacterium]|nr:2-C-methyl-D-erythritol 2,4-cyclodiphosphate synthase [Clostridiaceae bacterium]